jgi:phytoene synthase
MTLQETAPLGPAPFPDPDPRREVARITRASGSSFGPAMRLLSRPRREGIWALYAFCRVIDDIADELEDRETKRRLLADWDAEILRIYEGRPVSAIGRALSGPVRAFGLPRGEFHMLVAGMRMDADGPLRAPLLAELRAYTRRVAGAVGLLSMRIFGAWRGEPSRRFALALADALQFTNILRDVEDDARMGRLYLPRELLARHGVPMRPADAAAHPALPAAAAELGALARAELAAARAQMPFHDPRALAPALMMMGAYAAYLDGMEAQGFRPSPRVRLSRTAKAAAGVGCVLGAWRSRLRG